MQRPEYQKVFAISQSAMKAFRTKTLQEFHELYIEQKDTDPDDKFAFGSLVDTIAFTPELMDERFYIPPYAVYIPGEKVKYIVDKVYKEAQATVETKNLLNEKGNLPEPIYVPNIQDIYDWQDLIIKYAKEIEYGGKTWSRTRIVETVGEDGQTYFRLLSESNGRYVITTQDNADAVEMVENLKKDPNTRGFFVQEEGETLLFQQELYVDYPFGEMILPLKASPDIIRFKHKQKTVQVPDFKTTHTSEEFLTIAKKFGYVVQVDFYAYIVKEWLKTYEDGVYADYEVEIPMNIVIDRKYKIPYVYEYSWEDLEIARHGSKDKDIEGWITTLNTIAWHVQNSIWDRPKELYQTGKIKLKIFK